MAGNLDSVLNRLGNPGRFQVLTFLLLAFNYIPVSINLVVMAFYAYTPPHTCRPEVDNEIATNSSNQTGVSYGTTMEDYGDVGDTNVSMVIGDHGKSGLVSSHYLCTYRKYVPDTNTTINYACPKGHFVYGLEAGEATIVTQWDLVCGDRYKAHLATTLFYVGFMLGGLVAGFLADRLGRRPVLLACLYLHAALGLAVAFAPNYAVFTALRLLQGMFVQGLHTASVVMVAELFQPRHRALATPVLELYFGAGVILAGVLAWVLGDWRHVQLAITAPIFLSLAYTWFIPESLRYLVSKKKEKAVAGVLERMARFNKVALESSKCAQDLCSGVGSRERRTSYSHLLATPQVRRRSVIICFVWLVANVAYFGLILESTELAGNRYHNYLIGASLELMAFLFTLGIIRIFGRKSILITYFVMAAVCCVVSGVLPQSSDGPVSFVAISTGFAISGRFFAAGLFSVLEMFSAELFPTVVRNMGVGACAFWGRIGAVISPQLLNLGQYTFRQLPVIVIGLMTLMGGVVTLALPETKGMPLPETIMEIEVEPPPIFLKDLEGDEVVAPLDPDADKKPADGLEENL